MSLLLLATAVRRLTTNVFRLAVDGTCRRRNSQSIDCAVVVAENSHRSCHSNFQSSSLLRPPGRVAKYRDRRICVSVCLSVPLRISKTTRPNFTKLSVYVTCGLGSILF